MRGLTVFKVLIHGVLSILFMKLLIDTIIYVFNIALEIGNDDITAEINK